MMEKLKTFLVAALLVVAIYAASAGVICLSVADIEFFVNYNYCPTCGQLMEVENE